MKMNSVTPPIRKSKATIYCDNENQAHGNGTFDYSENKAKRINIVLYNSHTLSGRDHFKLGT